MAVIAREEVTKRRNGQKIQHRDEIAGERCDCRLSPDGNAEERGAYRCEGNGRQRGKGNLLRVARDNRLFADELEHIRQRLIPRRPLAVLHAGVDLSIHIFQQKRKRTEKQQPGEDEHLEDLKQHACVPPLKMDEWRLRPGRYRATYIAQCRRHEFDPSSPAAHPRFR